MLRFFTGHIWVKVAAVLGLVMVLTAAAMIAVSADFARSVGERAADRRAEALEGQALRDLRRTTAERARRYGAQLRRTEALSRMLALRAEDMLANPGAFRHPEPELHPVPAKGMLSNGPEGPVSVVYFAGDHLSDPARRELSLLAPLDPLLRHAQQEGFSAVAAWVTGKRGFVRYYPNLPLIEQLPGAEDFDARDDPFFRKAAPERNPKGGSVWTRVYRDPAGQGLMATVATPVHGPEEEFRAVTGVDLELNGLFQGAPGNQPGPSGEGRASSEPFNFLADGDGRLIAFPRSRLADFGIPVPEDPAPGEVLRYNLPSPGKSGLGPLISRARGKRGSPLGRVRSEEGDYLVAAHRVPGTGWILGRAVSEGAVLGGVRQARDRIGANVASQAQYLTVVALGLLAISLFVVTGYVAWSVVRPLGLLARTAERVSAGDYGAHFPVERQDELGKVARTFNDMSDRLATLIQDLEQRVAERTAKAESARRLFERILESSPVGIAFLDGERRIRQANPAILDLFPYREEDVLGRTPYMLYASDEEYEEVGREAYSRLRAGESFEATTRLLHADGTPFPVIIRGQAVDPEDLGEGFIWTIEDITERKKQEEELRLLAATFSNSQATFITDPQGVIERVNPAFTAIAGFSAEEAIGHSPGILKSGCHDTAFYREMWRRLLEEGEWEGEIWNRLKSGEIRPFYEAISVVRDEAGGIEHFVSVFHDISEQKRLEAELDHQASHDRLTGVFNRKQIEEHLDLEIGRSERYGTPFALIMFDLDHFKSVNDSFGHQVGDQILVWVSRLIEGRLRDSDLLARWGGEEFMILLPHTEAEEAARLAERLRLLVVEQEVPGQPSVTLSLAVTEYRPGEDIKGLTKRLDQALYRAKGSGRNRVEVARP